MQNCIITIGREYGSGGRAVGQEVAQKLGFAYYDKELLTKASAESGIHENLFINADEKPTNSLLYSISMGAQTYPSGIFFQSSDLLTNDSLFAIQADVIRKIAAEQSAVIIGRCADYILEGAPGLIKVFIHSDMEHRKERIIRLYDVKPKDVESVIRKNDKRRANYYSFYAAREWGYAPNYNLSIDTGFWGFEEAVQMIEMVQQKRR